MPHCSSKTYDGEQGDDDEGHDEEHDEDDGPATVAMFSAAALQDTVATDMCSV